MPLSRPDTRCRTGHGRAQGRGPVGRNTSLLAEPAPLGSRSPATVLDSPWVMASAVKPNRERPVVAVPTDAGTTARCARDIENRTLERSRATSTRLREGLTVMISVVTVEDRPGTITWQRRRQYAAAAAFIGSSLLWFVS